MAGRLRAEQLFDRGRLLAQTPARSTGSAPRWCWSGGSRGAGSGRDRFATTVLSFYDAAGEDLTTQERAHTQAYLGVADGLVLLLDPWQLPGRAGPDRRAGRRRCGTPSRRWRCCTGSPSCCGSRTGCRPAKRVPIPLAVVFAKIDAFFPVLGSDHPLLHPAAGRRRLRRGPAGRSTHEQVRALLHEYGADDIDQHLELNYADFRYFAVSALGAAPGLRATAVVDAGGVRPFRVDEPLLWLLHRFGVIGAEPARDAPERRFGALYYTDCRPGPGSAGRRRVPVPGRRPGRRPPRRWRWCSAPRSTSRRPAGCASAGRSPTTRARWRTSAPTGCWSPRPAATSGRRRTAPARATSSPTPWSPGTRPTTGWSGRPSCGRRRAGRPARRPAPSWPGCPPTRLPGRWTPRPCGTGSAPPPAARRCWSRCSRPCSGSPIRRGAAPIALITVGPGAGRLLDRRGHPAAAPAGRAAGQLQDLRRGRQLRPARHHRAAPGVGRAVGRPGRGQRAAPCSTWTPVGPHPVEPTAAARFWVPRFLARGRLRRGRRGRAGRPVRRARDVDGDDPASRARPTGSPPSVVAAGERHRQPRSRPTRLAGLAAGRAGAGRRTSPGTRVLDAVLCRRPRVRGAAHAGRGGRRSAAGPPPRSRCATPCCAARARRGCWRPPDGDRRAARAAAPNRAVDGPAAGRRTAAPARRGRAGVRAARGPPGPGSGAAHPGPPAPACTRATAAVPRRRARLRRAGGWTGPEPELEPGPLAGAPGGPGLGARRAARAAGRPARAEAAVRHPPHGGGVLCTRTPGDPADPLDQLVIAAAARAPGADGRGPTCCADVLFGAFGPRPPGEHPGTLAWRVCSAPPRRRSAEARAFLVALREHGSVAVRPGRRRPSARCWPREPDAVRARPLVRRASCTGWAGRCRRPRPSWPCGTVQVSRLLDELRAAGAHRPPGPAAALLDRRARRGARGPRRRAGGRPAAARRGRSPLDVLRGAARPPFRLVRAAGAALAPAGPRRPDRAGCRAVALTFLLVRGPSTQPRPGPTSSGACCGGWRTGCWPCPSRPGPPSRPRYAAAVGQAVAGLGRAGVTSTRRRLLRRFDVPVRADRAGGGAEPCPWCSARWSAWSLYTAACYVAVRYLLLPAAPWMLLAGAGCRRAAGGRGAGRHPAAARGLAPATVTPADAAARLPAVRSAFARDAARPHYLFAQGRDDLRAAATNTIGTVGRDLGGCWPSSSPGVPPVLLAWPLLAFPLFAPDRADAGRALGFGLAHLRGARAGAGRGLAGLAAGGRRAARGRPGGAPDCAGPGRPATIPAATTAPGCRPSAARAVPGCTTTSGPAGSACCPGSAPAGPAADHGVLRASRRAGRGVPDVRPAAARRRRRC